MTVRIAHWQVLAAFCALAAGACGDAPCPDDARDRAADLEVLFDGCTLGDRGCVLKAGGAVTLWYAAALDWRLDLALPRGWREVESREHRGGRRVVVRAEDRVGPGTVTVSATRGDRCARWSLDVVVDPGPSFDPDSSSVESLEADLRARPRDPAARLDRLARLRARRGDAWPPVLLLAIAHHRRAGRIGRVLRDWAFLHQKLVDDAEFVEARAVLDHLPTEAGLAGRSATARFLVYYQRALHAEKTADPGSSAGWSARALRVAERIGRPAFEAAALQLLARQNRRLGLHDQADEMFAHLAERVEDLPIAAVSKSGHLNNIGWDRVMSRDLGRPAEDPRPVLERSLALLGDGHEDRRERIVRHLNLAHAALQRGAPGRAARHLADASAIDVEPWPRDVLWTRIIEARLAIARGDPETALAKVEAIGSLRLDLLTVDIRLAVAEIEARARQLLGQRRQALDILEGAQQLLDETAAGLLPGSAAANTVAQDVPLTRAWLRRLLEDGQVESAFEAVGRAFARISGGHAGGACLERLEPSVRARRRDEAARLRGRSEHLNESAARLASQPMDQRARALEGLKAAADELVREVRRWQRSVIEGCALDPRDDARRRDPSEVVLALYPLADAWLAFWAGEDGVTVERLEPLPSPPALDGTALDAPDALAARALAVHAERIVRAAEQGRKVLRILAWGELSTAVDFHALEVAGKVLVEHLPVVYEVALPKRRESTTRRAGVVGDPLRDLPHAAREAEAVAAALRERNLEVTALYGEHADSAATRRLFERMDHLHFAGHGEVDGVRGETALMLAGRAKLTSGDLWLLDAVPSAVVLLACNTIGGAPTDLARTDLARTLVERGASRVVASTGDVDDEAAARFSRLLYAAWDGGDGAAFAVRGAQLALRDAMPGEGWSRFRLVERR